MKTAELIGPALDWAVAKCEGYSSEQALDIIYCDSAALAYSTDWAQGGPIIEQEGIDLYCNTIAQPNHADQAWRTGSWRARICSMGRKGEMAYGPTPLIAAMRCYVASKLGDEIEIPEELK